MASFFGRIMQIISGLVEMCAGVVVEWAARLRAAGGRTIPLMLLKLVCGARSEDFEDPGRLYERLSRRLSKFSPELKSACLWFLSNTLISDGHAATAAALLELEAGLERELYEDPPALSARLEAYFGDSEPAVRTVFLIGLGNALARAMRHADGLVFLEAALGLTPEDYGDRSRLNACLEGKLGPGDSDIKTFVAMLVASALVKAGRKTDTIAMIEADLDIDEKDDEDPIRWREIVQARWGKIDPRLAIIQIAMSAGMLDVADRPRAATALLEAGLDLKPGDYRDRNGLKSKFRSKFLGLPEDVRTYTLQLLAGALVSVGREEDGRELLALMQGVQTGDLANAGRSRGKLRGYCGSDSEAGDLYQQLVREILSQAVPGAFSSAALDLDRIFNANDWADEGTVRARLKQEVDGKRLDFAAAGVVQMLAALEERGHEDRAALLVDVFHYEYSPMKALADEPFGAIALSPLYEKWLRYWGKEARRRPLNVCQELVTYLRAMVLERGRNLHDREEFIRSLAHLRRRIVQTGFYWVEQEKNGSAPNLRRTVLFWDLEMTQRLLLERLLRTKIASAPAVEPPLPGQWPLSLKDLPPTDDYLPDTDTIQRSLGALSQIATLAQPATLESFEEGDPSELAVQFESLVRGGVDEPVLAECLEEALFLRVTFDIDGTLVWTVLESEGDRLRVMGHGSGSPKDLTRLRWAAAQHDFRLGWLYWNQELQKEVRMLRQYVRDKVAEVLRTTAGVFRPDLSPDDGQIQDFYQAFHDLAEKTGGWGENPFVLSIMAPLVRMIATAIDLENAESYIAWAERVKEELGKMARSVLEEQDEEPFRTVLDRTTGDYLRAVGAIWDLEPVMSLLSAERDLVVQVDDVLHSVPIAYLQVGRKALHSRVRSVRGSLSPVLDTVLAEIEDGARARPRDRRLLSVSFFESTDSARDAGIWLHHGQLHLAEIHACECVMAADSPAGSLGTIRGALARYGGFTVGSVCGHGDLLQAGITLSGEDGDPVLWRGDGCDLSGIDWLVFVSCSIGRAVQTGDLDVEGFCAQLFAHRARAVAACRWPVPSTQAAAFANEVVHQYLKLLKEESKGGVALRAKALNKAREQFSGMVGDRYIVGINTAAAFELYGLG